MRTREDIRLRLKELREARRLTQVALAAAAGLHPNKISHMESGKGLPSIKNAWALADGLGCSLDQLVGRDPSRNSSRDMSDAELLDELRFRLTKGTTP